MATVLENRFLWAFHAAILVCVSGVTIFVLSHFNRDFIIGHDEAVYATEARSWISGGPADQFEIYRPVGMAAAAWIVLHFGSSEAWLRIFGVIFGAFFPMSIYVLFRQASNLWVTLAVVVTAITSNLFFEQAPRLLDDIASTSLLICVAALVYSYYKSGGESSSIYFVAPVAALAFYLRYGSVTALLTIGVFSYLLLLPRLLQQSKPRFEKIGYGILLATLFFTPHIVTSIWQTGSPIGILQLAGRAAHRIYFGEGLIQYLHWLPQDIAGWPMGVTAIFGVGILLFLLLTPLREKFLGLAWIGCIGFATFVLNGLLVHAETRYVFFPMTLLSGVGIAGVYHLIERWSSLVAMTLLGAYLIAAGYFGIIHYKEANQFFLDESLIAFNMQYKDALTAVRADRAENPCGIWTALNRPRASWYAGCSMYKITDKNQFFEDMNRTPGTWTYSIVGSRASGLQITPEVAERYGMKASEIFHSTNPTVGDLIVYRITLL